MPQVVDDIDLLELMISDYKESSVDYQATARWAEYSDRFLNFLRSDGLKDFRSRRFEKGSAGAVLGSFGALDINPSASRAIPVDMYHHAASSFIGPSAKTLPELRPSRVGNPEGFEIDGNFYTLSWLNYYCRYAYVSKYIDFSDQMIVEVGPGTGKQAEMLKKAHPDLTIVLFDLPTQLYVTNQFLSKVFEGKDQVVDYRQGKKFQSSADIVKGKINILPHWKFPIMDGVNFDLLWNAASFQEMGHDTALTYLDAAHNAEAMFLMYNIKYRPNVPAPGSRGVCDPAKIKNHTEIDRAIAKLAFTPQTWIYFDSFWKKK